MYTLATGIHTSNDVNRDKWENISSRQISAHNSATLQYRTTQKHAAKHNKNTTLERILIIQQGVALTRRNTTGPPCSVARPARSVTDDDRCQ